eukprot:gnl/Spiro4/15028_TR8098_c0_g1_i1.p1 gnl/Spiro4/15028_TR8098_c0_g1~~gnl/Spiro4/15028_TR8098_c0_g1_i1.p1  ORF type:complete len:592 (+),score=99.95 gnl/Spiro4/15028_TR8098_c0_g1_i1:33-1778(+)
MTVRALLVLLLVCFVVDAVSKRRVKAFIKHLAGKDCPNKCSAHGKCVNNNCVCDDGYINDDCSVPYTDRAYIKSMGALFSPPNAFDETLEFIHNLAKDSAQHLERSMASNSLPKRDLDTPDSTDALACGFPANLNTRVAETYAIASTSLTTLIEEWLKIMKVWGSPIERQFYETATVASMVKRFLEKRPLMFMSTSDVTLFPDSPSNQAPSSLNGEWLLVGDDYEEKLSDDTKLIRKQTDRIQLKDYLSYREMPLSALLSASVFTKFINNCNKYNRAKPSSGSDFHQAGFLVGGVGPRLELLSVMESRYLLITAEANEGLFPSSTTPALLDYLHSQLDQMWNKFFNLPHSKKLHWKLPTFEQLKQSLEDQEDFYDPEVCHADDFTKSCLFAYHEEKNVFVNVVAYKRRMRLTLEPLLANANERGKLLSSYRHVKDKEDGTKSTFKGMFVRIAGFGLGVWGQEIELLKQLFNDVVLEILDENDFAPRIAVVEMMYSWGDRESIPNKNGVEVRYTKSNIANPIDKDMELIASYAWDGNSFPGNEYWGKLLDASLDPAAACCSEITRLQNPLLNPTLWNKAKFY